MDDACRNTAAVGEVAARAARERGQGVASICGSSASGLIGSRSSSSSNSSGGVSSSGGIGGASAPRSMMAASMGEEHFYGGAPMLHAMTAASPHNITPLRVSPAWARKVKCGISEEGHSVSQADTHTPTT